MSTDVSVKEEKQLIECTEIQLSSLGSLSDEISQIATATQLKSDFHLSKIVTRKAIEHEISREIVRKGAVGIDGISAKQLRKTLTRDKTDQLVTDIITLKYQPKPLKVCRILKGNGSFREIWIPTVLDRIVQRILATALAKVIDPFLCQFTLGYRSGYSIESALRICAQYNQSEDLVVETDIEDFFNGVNRDRLMGYLQTLGLDRKSLRLIRKFLEAPRVERDGSISRKATGIPQGSPLSPVLANLYLKNLDRALLFEGFRFVRYADDFVVFFDRNAEKHPLGVIKHELRKLGLRHKPNKTRVVDLSQGESYQFLGLAAFPDGTFTHCDGRVCEASKLSEFLNLKKYKRRFHSHWNHRERVNRISKAFKEKAKFCSEFRL